MKTNISSFCTAALLGAALLASISVAPTALQAQDHKVIYHDTQHNDDHEWNSHENLAYRRYAKDNHRKYRPFVQLNENDRQAYWGWRHEHSDAQLNITIR